jgi:dTDP-4-dehydrorhamnose reductase
MRVTIFGATGLLGKTLTHDWNGDKVSGLGSKDADIRESKQVYQALERTRPDLVVLTAAYTDVDGCEQNPEYALDVNFRGALNVAQAARRFGSGLLFLSTDYVFDGAKANPYETDDPRSPLNVYGQSKAEAEVQISQISPEFCILRTSWLFGIDGKCFPDTILQLAASRPIIEVVDDQRGSPTYAADLAQAIIQLCRARAKGIVHATNRGNCSWFEFAREIVRAAGLTAEVHPVKSEHFPRPAKRPKYSVLSSKSLDKYGIDMPNWQDALKRFLLKRTSVLAREPSDALPRIPG